MNMHVIRSDLAVDSISPQPATHDRRAAKTRQRVRKLREMASAEIERLIAFLDASDGYSMDEREEAVDDEPSLGWTRSGAHGDTLDREIGEAAL